ncbi:MAG: hypothetical protein ACO363_06050 [Balneolaceae bacterium]
MSQPTTADELQELARWRMDAKDTPFLLVGTKADLDMAVVSGSSSPRQEQRLQYDLIISAVSGENINPLKKLMKERALEHRDLDGGSLLVTSTRHRDALQKAREHVKQALEALDMGLTGDLLAIDLRAALHDLGTVTGEITNEDLLDSIFSRFCIGK